MQRGWGGEPAQTAWGGSHSLPPPPAEQTPSSLMNPKFQPNFPPISEAAMLGTSSEST